MGSQPVTTNPLLIMLINMIVVFVVLWGLSWVIRLIQVFDPTKKKAEIITKGPAAAPLTKTVSAVLVEQDEEDMIVVLAAAVAAYSYNQYRISSIRRIDGDGRTWSLAGRFDAINVRKQMN